LAAAHKAAVDAQVEQQAAVEFQDVGYEETQPHQEEIVAGTVEHVQLLNAFPNATSYAGDVNVVVPEPVEEPPPVEPPPEEPVTTQQARY
jgi:hypothetical protein